MDKSASGPAPARRLALPTAVAPGALVDPAAVYLARLAPRSQTTMRACQQVLARLASAGRQSAETLPWAALRYQHTQALRAALAARYAPATANLHLAALRGTLRECWRLGLVDADDYQRAIDLAPVRGSSLPRGRALAGDELARLLAVCAVDTSAAGRRDGAALAVLYGCGLRRAELVALDLADWDAAGGTLRVRGKGATIRLAFGTPEIDAALDAWRACRGPAPGALFTGIHRAGRVTGRRLSTEAVRYVVRRRAAQAGIPSLSPHDLRRSFVGDLLDAGADLATVQKMAGHASVETTARYDRRGDATRRAAARLLRLPGLFGAK